METEKNLKLWEKNGFRRVYLNDPEYSDMKVWFSTEGMAGNNVAVHIKRDWPMDSQTRDMLEEIIYSKYAEEAAAMLGGKTI